jgi:hypothetical protein
MGHSLHHENSVSPAVFANHNVASVVGSLTVSETADYISAMLYALEGMAVAKQFDGLSRLLKYARDEARFLK